VLNKKFLLIALVAFGLAGCAADPMKPEGVDTGGEAAPSDGAEATPGYGDGDINAMAISEEGEFGNYPGDPLSHRRIFFEYNSYSVEPAAQAVIEAHSQYLVGHPGTNITLEGHADERGTREYNLALGEKRAEAVAELMSALGVDRNRIVTTSYGEEKPLELGHNEAAWSKNRRVELIY